MKTADSLHEAREVPNVTHIHRVTDDEWEAYEPGDEVPPEYLCGEPEGDDGKA